MLSIPRTLVFPILLAGTTPALKSQGLPVIGEIRDYPHTAIQTLDADPMATVLGAEHVVRMPGRAWVQIEFESVRLVGDSRLEITSLQDGDRQVFNRHNASTESAYFNGDAVRIRLWAAPNTRGSSFRIRRVAFASASNVTPASVCSGTDTRTPSSDKRVARLITKSGSTVVTWGTGFLISQWNCMATAGHGIRGRSSVTAQFNVPNSASCNSLRHPSAKDQYDWTGAHGFWDAGHGADWAVFTVKRNRDSGLYPAEAQGGYFRLSTTATGTSQMTVTGYGVDYDHPTRCRAQQKATGASHGVSGQMLRYGAFTLGGSSGSPVIASTGWVHAIHTGCIGNTRVGTRTTHPIFREWYEKLCKRPRNPDLKAEAMQTNASGTMIAGNTYIFQSRIANAGGANSPATTSSYVLSKDSTVSSEDAAVHSFTTRSLAPGQKHTHTANVELSPLLDAGRRWPGVCADRYGRVAELFENNNCKAAAPVNVRALPDFTVESMDSDAFFIWPDKTIKLTAKIKNSGVASAASTQHGFHLSRDNVITPIFDVLLGTFSTGVLGVGKTQTVSKNIKLPHANVEGLCYLGVFADHGKSRNERSETNNAKAVAAMCEPKPCPDLIVTKLAASTTTFQAGTPVQLSSTVQNFGTATAAWTRLRYLLSSDATLSADDTVLWTATTPSLVKFALRDHARSIQIPSTVTPGRCWLLAVADYDNRVVECKENNNVKALAVTCVGKADLTTSFLGVRNSISAGDRVAMAVHTKNVGTAASGQTLSGWFLSGNSTLSTGDTYLGGHRVPVLSANQEHKVTVQVQIPFCTDPGSYYLGALADPASTIAELNEINNGRSIRVDMAAYAGAERRIEWRGARFANTAGPYLPTQARADAATGVHAKMCVVAPQHAGKFYLCLLSKSAKTFALDSYSELGLTFLNTPFFSNWFGQLPANGKAFPTLHLPGGALTSRERLYVHVLYVGGQGLDGFGDNRLLLDVR